MEANKFVLNVLSAKPVSDGSIQEVASRAVSDLEFENYQSHIFD